MMKAQYEDEDCLPKCASGARVVGAIGIHAGLFKSRQRNVGEPNALPKCIAEQKVLRDGTVVIHKADCSTQAKARFADGQAESGSTKKKVLSCPHRVLIR